MAQALTDIYNSLIAQKQTMTALNGLQPSVDNAQTLLANLTTASKVAVWRLLLFVVAVGLWVEQTMWDTFQSQIQAIVNSAIPGTPKWYAQQALQFQLGYALVWLNNKFQYSDTTSPAALAAQIVTQSACVSVNRQVIVKAAQMISGVVSPLTNTQLAAFNAYMQQINFAGVNLLCTSWVADLLYLQYTVYYDPNVLAADGESLASPGDYPVEDAINSFISNLPFNGILRLSSLTAFIEAVPGVIDPELTLAQAKYGALPYSAISIIYTPNAGYLEIDPAHPLRTNITYIPYLST